MVALGRRIHNGLGHAGRAPPPKLTPWPRLRDEADPPPKLTPPPKPKAEKGHPVNVGRAVRRLRIQRRALTPFALPQGKKGKGPQIATTAATVFLGDDSSPSSSSGSTTLELRGLF